MPTLFGVDATTLSDPKGAGTQPLTPVQERVADPGYDGMLNVINGVGTSAASFFKEQEKKNPPWMQVRNEFQQRLAVLSEAANQATDGISRNKYITQARSMYNQYMANYAHLGEDFSKSISNAYTYNKTGSGLDELEDVRKKEIENEQKVIQEWANQGLLPAFGDVTPEQRQAVLSTAQNFNRQKKIQEELLAAEDREMKRNAEGRAQSNFAYEQHKQTMALQSQQNLSPLLASGVDLLMANTDAAMAAINSGKMDFATGWATVERALMIQRQNGNIALQGDSQALSTYNSFMDNYMKVVKEYLDPATRTKSVEDEYTRMINMEKLRLARKPGGSTAIVLGQLMGPDVFTKVNSSRFLNSIADDIDSAYTTKTIPSVMSGNAGAQAAVFDSVRGQVARASRGEAMNSKEIYDQAADFANATLNTLGSLDPDSPKSLAYVNDFMSSPEFGELVKQGKISPTMAAKAYEPFVQNYAKGLGKTFSNWLYSTVGEATYTNGVRDVNKTPTNVQLLRFEIDDEGQMKVVESRDPGYNYVMSNYHAAALRSKAEKQAAEIGKAVRSYAHIQGSTDYKKAWQEIRHELVPGQYPTPDRVAEAMADGWDGVGFFDNKSSWKRNNGTAGTTK